MKKSLAILCAALVAAIMPVSANAATTVAGDRIVCSTNTYPNSRCNGDPSDTVPVVFGTDEAEFEIFATPNFDPLLLIDFENGLLTLTSLGNRTITSTILTFTNLDNPFTFIGTGTGLLAGRASITNGVLRVDLRNIRFTTGAVSTFNTPAVPEPGTWLLMILGLGAVGFAMRRRQIATARYQFA